MSNPILTDLLGKHIQILPNYNLSSELENVTIYKSNLKGTFLGKPFNELGVIADKQDIITEVSIYFPEVIDNTFYDLLIGKYGHPNNILKLGKVMKNGEIMNSNLLKLYLN